MGFRTGEIEIETARIDKVKVMEAGGDRWVGVWCGDGEETEWPRRRLSPISSVECMVCAEYAR